MSQAYNQQTVRCTNTTCPHEGEGRVVSLPIVGAGLCMTGEVLCECGATCVVLDVTD